MSAWLGLRSRTVVVTGAASGIGSAVVAELLSVGARVIAIDRDSSKMSQKAVHWPADSVLSCVADAVELTEMQAIARRGIDRFGRLDGIVANAAITRAGTVEEFTPAEWRDVMANNLESVYVAAKAFVPAMRDTAGGGAVVAIASQMGLVGTVRNAAYCAAKAGVVNLVRAMALDLARCNVRVNCVCPGPIETPMLREGFRQTGDTEESVISHVPMGRLGKASEVAAVVAVLLSERSSYVTGAAWVADGGYVAV